MSAQERNKSENDVHKNKPFWVRKIYIHTFPYLHECQLEWPMIHYRTDV